MANISFIKEKKLILRFETEREIEWIKEYLFDRNKLLFSKVFNFDDDDLILYQNSKDDFEPNIVKLKLGSLENDGYYKIKGTKLHLRNDLYIHESIDLDLNFFLLKRSPSLKISLFKKIDLFLDEDIYIGGKKKSSISYEEYQKIKKKSPTNYELSLYFDARLTTILSSYFDSVSNVEEKYEKYINKRPSRKGINITQYFKKYEQEKYELILNKLTEMLKNQEKYAEKIWQKEILQILRLIYPKYIATLSEVKISTDDSRVKYLDYALVDINGNIDIFELKRPLNEQLITSKKSYRNNYTPRSKLSGTIMQIEKYIYYLSRWGERGEKILSERYQKKKEIPKNFKLKITNPSGYIIMGRDNTFNEYQKQDLEIIKRKYKHIIDIITYDDLIRRLEFLVKSFQ